MRIKLKAYLFYTCGVSLLCLHLTLRYSLGLIDQDDLSSTHPTEHHHQHCDHEKLNLKVHLIPNRTSQSNTIISVNGGATEQIHSGISNKIIHTDINLFDNDRKSHTSENKTVRKGIQKWLHQYISGDRLSYQEKHYR